jgi:hypothetical protein
MAEDSLMTAEKIPVDTPLLRAKADPDGLGPFPPAQLCARVALSGASALRVAMRNKDNFVCKWIRHGHLRREAVSVWCDGCENLHHVLLFGVDARSPAGENWGTQVCGHDNFVQDGSFYR